ncbi:serine/arginine repetitive matrix protein 2-like [Watersipora subatra]|uniref:serine/arginine repetitive matrix protein 2-like n=1 Tax=Watersipora subatra TaxID=2589382 RepID=UPI00355AD706
MLAGCPFVARFSRSTPWGPASSTRERLTRSRSPIDRKPSPLRPSGFHRSSSYCHHDKRTRSLQPPSRTTFRADRVATLPAGPVVATPQRALRPGGGRSVDRSSAIHFRGRTIRSRKSLTDPRRLGAPRSSRPAAANGGAHVRSPSQFVQGAATARPREPGTLLYGDRCRWHSSLPIGFDAADSPRDRTGRSRRHCRRPQGRRGGRSAARRRPPFGFPPTSAFPGRSSRPRPTAPWSVFRDGSRRRTLGGTRPPGTGRAATRATPEHSLPGRDPPIAPSAAARRTPRRGCRRASAATISRALSLSLQSSFRRSLAVRLVRYRNRAVISLGRASPAAFGLRYKAGLLALGGPSARAVGDPRGSNSPRPMATFQSSWSPATRARLPLVTTPRPPAGPRIRRRTPSFSFATTRDLPVGFSCSR